MTETNITRQIVVRPTPEEIAECFANFDNIKQAIFFNEVANHAKKWQLEGQGNPGLHNFCFQMQSIIDSGILTDGAKYIMKEIGNYAQTT